VKSYVKSVEQIVKEEDDILREKIQVIRELDNMEKLRKAEELVHSTQQKISELRSNRILSEHINEGMRMRYIKKQQESLKEDRLQRVETALEQLLSRNMNILKN